MTEAAQAITTEICRLHREVLDGKIDGLREKDKTLETRMKGIEEGIEEVRDLQIKILYAIIASAILGFTTLLGVTFGRVIDLGFWIF